MVDRNGATLQIGACAMLNDAQIYHLRMRTYFDQIAAGCRERVKLLEDDEFTGFLSYLVNSDTDREKRAGFDLVSGANCRRELDGEVNIPRGFFGKNTMKSPLRVALI
jgi:hypothetical protein